MIRTIKLAEKKIQEVDGVFVEIKTNERTVPLLINHRALNYGLKNGHIQTTVLKDFMSLEEGNIDLCYHLLYLGAIGANQAFNTILSYDDFVNQLDIPVESIAYTVQSLFYSNLPDTMDQFIGELEKKTTPSDSKKK